MQESRDKLFAALVESRAVLGGCSQSGLPAKSRWGTMTTQLKRRVSGIMLSRLEPRCFATAFQRWGDGAPDGEQENDFHVYCKGKVHRAKLNLNDFSTNCEWCMISFSCLDIDHLWKHIQYAEEQGSIVLDLLKPETNCFTQCQSKLTRTLAAAPSGATAPVFRHFGNTEDARVDLLSTARDFILPFKAQLWWRVERVLSDWPFKLFGCVAPNVDLQQLSREWSGVPWCCLDAAASRKAPIVCWYLLNSQLVRSLRSVVAPC